VINIAFPIWKPIDWTSFDVVKKVRNKIKPSKVGHAGTLDPFAEGVLVICSGNKTKTINKYMALAKEYKFQIILGVETDTMDPTGKIISQSTIPVMNKDTIMEVLNNFQGEISQEPPMYSALKFNGIPLYKLARKGIVVKRKRRLINIYKIKLNSFTNHSIDLTVQCGKGTYIRSLGVDIAKSLKTVGYVNELVRTKIGKFDKNSCIKINELSKWLSLEK